MTDSLATGALRVYRWVGLAAGPWVRRHLDKRGQRGREDPARLHERFGEASLPRPEGPLVWVHAASVGEALSALPLIERIHREWPGLALLLTTGTVTSAQIMAERLPAGVIHQYAPVDLPGAVEKFIAHWRPSLGLVMESEFWPGLLGAARARGCRLAVVNGRISADSFASWSRVKPLIRGLLRNFDLVLAQSPEDQAHFEALGAAKTRYPGNLKFAGPPLAADAKLLEALETALAGRSLWLAASTHPGEEELVAEAHAAIAGKRPGLLTLLAPRHPDRGEAIAELLRARGLTVARRSLGEHVTPETDVYLADTIGELGLWYRLAGVVFVGGSLVRHGGQNPLEPAKLDCAILTGPHAFNFLRVTREMTGSGAEREVADAAGLAEAVLELLEDEAARGEMAAQARAYAERQEGVIDTVMAELGPLLDAAAKGEPIR